MGWTQIARDSAEESESGHSRARISGLSPTLRYCGLFDSQGTMKTLTLSTDLPQWVLELAEFVLVSIALLFGREVYSDIKKQD